MVLRLLLAAHDRRTCNDYLIGHCRTAVAVAGDDYCIVAASTRLSTGFQILKRDSSMILKLCALRTHANILHT